jgi:hypothetical protein
MSHDLKTPFFSLETRIKLNGDKTHMRTLYKIALIGVGAFAAYTFFIIVYARFTYKDPDSTRLGFLGLYAPWVFLIPQLGQYAMR